MIIYKNRLFTAFFWILVSTLFVVTSLTIAFNYLNTSEINIASTRCYEVEGKVILKIHNNITSAYSYECKKNIILLIRNIK